MGQLPLMGALNAIDRQPQGVSHLALNLRIALTPDGCSTPRQANVVSLQVHLHSDLNVKADKPQLQNFVKGNT